MTTVRELVPIVARKMGDSEYAVWSYDEWLQYISDGYVDLTFRVPQLWDRQYVENLPFAANYDFSWELAYFVVGDVVEGHSDIDFPWERDYFEGTDPPGNYDFHWERKAFILDIATLQATRIGIPGLDEQGYLYDDYIPATAELPETVQDITRGTFDSHHIPSVGYGELQSRNPTYETYAAAEQVAYTASKDGIQVVRKYPVPSQRSDELTYLTRWGSIRGVLTILEAVTRRMSIDEFHPGGPTGVIDSTERSRFLLFGMLAIPDAAGGFDPTSSTFAPLSSILSGLSGLYIGSYGGPYDPSITSFATITALRGTIRVIPRHFPVNGPHGIPKRLIREHNNFRLEVHRRPQPAVLYDVEVPRTFRLHLHFYAMHKAFRKRGVGQNVKMSDHYRDRYEAGVARMRARANSAGAGRRTVIGGASPRPPAMSEFPVYPSNFGYARYSLRSGRMFRR